MPKCTFLIGVPGSGKSTWFDKNQSGTLISSRSEERRVGKEC